MSSQHFINLRKEMNFMGTVNLILDCTTRYQPLLVRSGPSTRYSVIGSIPVGAKNIKATKEQNGWYYTDRGGWSSSNYLKVVKNLGNSIETPTQEKVQTVVKSKEEILQEQMNSYIGYEEDVKSVGDPTNLIATSMEGIYGIPYQFMASVDRKIDNTQFGTLYADKIISRMPLLLISPGKVNFMRDWKSKSAAAQGLQKLLESATPTDLNTIIDNHGRYYTFDFDYVNYYKCVDAMCVTGAYFLGLQDTQIKVSGKWTALKNVSWANCGQNSFKSILSNREYVAFYIDSASTVNEDFSNSTTESQLASKINSFSDTGRELNFLLGVTTGNQFVENYGDSAAIESAMQTIQDISNQYLNGSQLFTDLAQNFATVAVGGKLIFPEIWSDSDYSKSYDINIKLRTPDGDKLSWFMNIYVPLAHLICLTAPREASESGPNGYSAPFLVKAFYKGLFNCDMGIVTSLNISRGKDKAWTLDGLPTEVDVSMTIKDLYSMMTLTSIDNPGSFVNNIALVDYIANSCGININEPDITRMLDVYVMLQSNRLKHVVPNAWYIIQQDIANRIRTSNDKLISLLGNLDSIPGL